MSQNSTSISSALEYLQHIIRSQSPQIEWVLQTRPRSDTMQYKLPTFALTVLLGYLAQAEAKSNNNVKFCDGAAQQVKQSAFAAWYSVQASPSTQPVRNILAIIHLTS